MNRTIISLLDNLFDCFEEIFALHQEYLKAVKFSYEDETVQFDRNGDPPGRYDIVNFQVSLRAALVGFGGS
jgi:hypothetical protein